MATNHVENHPRWDPNMRLDQETPGPIGVGMKIRRRHTRGEAPVEGEMEVVELEPDRSMGVVIRDGPMELSSRMIVEPQGEGHTRLTFEVVGRMPPSR